MWVRLIGVGARILQLMILLSALLASLTGLMVGEGPVAPAQVEVSASTDVAAASTTVLAAVDAPVISPSFVARPQTNPGMLVAGSVALRDSRFHLDMKQSWLI